jgi:CRISPR/Cas system CMR subunit Cmr6 (Cas7 group RAMP superfamily)
MEGKKQKTKTMGWVERFGEIIFLHALPSPPSNYLQTPQPNKFLIFGSVGF